MLASQEALDYASQLAHPFSLAYAMTWKGLLLSHLRAFGAAQVLAEALLAYCQEHHIHYWLPHTLMMLGWARAGQGDIMNGIASIRQGMEGWQASGAEIERPLFLSVLGELYGRAGEVEQGLALIAESIDLGGKREERWSDADIHRRLGELLLLKGDETAAGEAFRYALEVASRQGARMLELRAALPLVRLWLKHGRKNEAFELLEPLYRWFGEGFDIPDMLDARDLLTLIETNSI